MLASSLALLNGYWLPSNFFVALNDVNLPKMKIFKADQVAFLDDYTIESEDIKSVDLMERASGCVTDWIVNHYQPLDVAVFAGPGNNGGDALAVARLLILKGFRVTVFVPSSDQKFSDCFQINLDRLANHAKVEVLDWKGNGPLPDLSKCQLILDGLFGSGLSRPLAGYPSELVKHLNQSNIPIISIDIPSGLKSEPDESISSESIITATHTLTFEFPKLTFFFEASAPYLGRWEILSIGIDSKAKELSETTWNYSDRNCISSIVHHRPKFSHKGTFGHALLVAGSKGKMGAAILAARASLRSGVGLLTVHVPACGNEIMHVSVPEAMVSDDGAELAVTKIPVSDAIKAVGIGPGIGTARETTNALKELLSICSVPLVLDADALNILSENRELLPLLPKNTILTPHPKELERLVGKSLSAFERLRLAVDFAKKYQVYVILKGAHTAMLLPDGQCWFNSTGNPGMATAGSGDVLTGILLGLVTQGYTSKEACLLGVYLHGLSGDLALENGSEESLVAGDLIENLGKAFTTLKNV